MSYAEFVALVALETKIMLTILPVITDPVNPVIHAPTTTYVKQKRVHTRRSSLACIITRLLSIEQTNVFGVQRIQCYGDKDV